MEHSALQLIPWYSLGNLKKYRHKVHLKLFGYLKYVRCTFKNDKLISF